MAKILPDVSESELLELTDKSPGEASVYRACRALPSDWVVLHGLRSMTLEQGVGPRDREGDFVLLHPGYGMLVIEVKSGEVRFGNGRWSRRLAGTDKDIQDPFAQATGMKHSLLQRLTSHIRWGEMNASRMLARHAVLLPDVKSADPVRLSHVHRELVGAAPELLTLADWVERAYKFGSTQEPWTPLGREGVELVIDILCAPFTTESLLGFRLRQEDRDILRLTSEQWRVNQCLRLESELAIGGAAGTGKTLLALRRAQDCARAGLKTLLLCYNRVLADFLKHENYRLIQEGEIVQELLVTNTFEAFCKWVVQDHAGTRTSKKFFEQAARDFPMASASDVQWPQAMALALEECPVRYDVVIVDEGQDFGDAHWFGLQDIWSNALKRYVFFDPNQSIFRRALQFPVRDERTVMLRKNCRNTMAIHELAYRFYQGPSVEHSGIEGRPLLRWEEEGIRGQALRLAREVNSLVEKEGVAPEDVAILVLSSRGKKFAYEAAAAAFKGRVTLSQESHGQAGRVVIDTVKRFKGLESLVVVLWAHERPDEDTFRELRYVGLSRAKSFLVVLGQRALLDIVLGDDSRRD